MVALIFGSFAGRNPTRGMRRFAASKSSPPKTMAKAFFFSDHPSERMWLLIFFLTGSHLCQSSSYPSYKGRFLGFAKRFVMFQALKLLPEVLSSIVFLSRRGNQPFRSTSLAREAGP